MEYNYDAMEGWLESLSMWKEHMELLQTQLSHLPGLTQRLELVNIHGEGHKSDSVLNEVIRRLRIQEEELPFWKLRVQLLEQAVSRLPEEDQRFVELRYRQRLDSRKMMERFHLSHSVFYRKRQEILQQLYAAVGGDHSILWVEHVGSGKERTLYSRAMS
jgi:DNA-directed RNA polymerase specialized sigma subunit